jgi:hypothetical protein
MANEVRADKSGTPGNKELHRFIKSLIEQPANKLALLNSSLELEPQTTEEWIFSPPSLPTRLQFGGICLQMTAQSFAIMGDETRSLSLSRQRKKVSEISQLRWANA